MLELNIDERPEALAMHLELLTRVHEDYEKKAEKLLEEFTRQMTAFAADVSPTATYLPAKIETCGLRGF